MRNGIHLVSVLILLVTGCAGVQIVRTNSDTPYKEGIRFYRPDPYLLVTKDKDGKNLEGKIIYLPNRNEEYAIRVRSGIGTVDTKFTLEDGWRLSQFGETRDSKTVEMVTALTGSLKGLVGLEMAPKREELQPGLYLFIFDEKTGFIKDLEPIVQFR